MFCHYFARVLSFWSQTTIHSPLVLDPERAQVFSKQVKHFNNNLMTSQRSKSLVNFEFSNPSRLVLEQADFLKAQKRASQRDLHQIKVNVDHLDMCLSQVKRYASIVINDLRLKHYRLVNELDKLLRNAI